RALFLEAAAARLGVAREALRVRDGEIYADGGSRTSYGALAPGVSLDRDASGQAARKPAAERRWIGRSMARRDLPDKVFGRARFVHDLQLRGMLHGRILRPPSPAAHLDSLDDAATRAMPGVVRVIRDGDFVGVVAEREEQAVAALESLRAAARWQERETLPDEGDLASWLRSQPVETTVVDEKIAEGGASSAVATRSASFSRPFIAHASIAPSCAVARWRSDKLEVFTHSQGPFNLRADLALALDVPPDDICVAHREGAGCYGHNGADDVALDAALLSRAVDGRPVRVLWSREDELTWAPFGAAMRMDIEADLDAGGEIVAWRGEVWSNGHTARPGRASTPMLLASWQVDDGFERPIAVNPPLAGGGGSERNAVPPYDIGARRVINHRVLSTPVRTSALRSLGAHLNVFAIESFIDDIARERGEDPIAWRLRHLSDPRARAVIQSVARRARWSSWQPAEGRGRGIGYARYKSKGAYCAVVAEIEAEREIRVRRLVIAVDVGLAVNPDGVANQVEGGAIQATSWTLREAVRFDRTRVTSAQWDDYPILRFSDVPAVEVEVLQREGEASVGAGEASMGPTAAAIGNAVRDALGVRVRDLPITRDRIGAA
ncbi:MAG: xanthine dehydrogenase family protein molybdopterin-binding subunit, partial [Bacillota bacterium]